MSLQTITDIFGKTKKAIMSTIVKAKTNLSLSTLAQVMLFQDGLGLMESNIKREVEMTFVVQTFILAVLIPALEIQCLGKTSCWKIGLKCQLEMWDLNHFRRCEQRIISVVLSLSYT